MHPWLASPTRPRHSRTPCAVHHTKPNFPWRGRHTSPRLGTDPKPWRITACSWVALIYNNEARPLGCQDHQKELGEEPYRLPSCIAKGAELTPPQKNNLKDSLDNSNERA